MAIILAAGKGDRLKPLTEDKPKCMLEVRGIPIITHLLQALSMLGIEYVLIVTGYKGEVIRREIGLRYQNIQINYLENPLFEENGNILSLWCARHFFYSNLLLFEGDIFLEPEIIRDLIACPHQDAVVIDKIDSFNLLTNPELVSETVVTIGDNGFLDNMSIGSEQIENLNLIGIYRTVKVYKLSVQFLREHLIGRLNLYISRGLVKEDYEVLVRDFILEGTVQFAPLIANPRRWIDINTLDNLNHAIRVFTP